MLMKFEDYIKYEEVNEFGSIIRKIVGKPYSQNHPGKKFDDSEHEKSAQRQKDEFRRQREKEQDDDKKRIEQEHEEERKTR